MECGKRCCLAITLVLLSGILFVNNASADWTIDVQSPICSITFAPTVPRAPGATSTVTAKADDITTGGSGIVSPLVFSLSPNLDLSALQSTVPTTYSLSQTYNWNPLTVNTYVFSLSAIDTAGNKCNPTNPYTLTVPIVENPPFLKTSGGDVHANQ